MTFSWCETNQHDQCRREYQRCYIDPKTNKVVLLNEWQYCQCPKRGCKCYVPAKDRKKTTTRRKSK